MKSKSSNKRKIISNDIMVTRKEEIVKACEKLYKTMSFKDITIKEIAKETSFTRPSIYNYFVTKEEIFLALYEKEYIRWNEDLLKIVKSNKKMTKKAFAEKIALSLSKREQLLKLMAMNNYDMEANSRLECLVSFKRAYLSSIDNFSHIISLYDASLNKKEIDEIVYMFFPFMYALYPYTHVTKKQKIAMEKAGHKWNGNSIYKLVYNFIIKVL